MFRSAAQYVITRFPYGMAFFTPGQNLMINPDGTVNWAVRFSGAVSYQSRTEAVGHVFLEVETGVRQKHRVVFVFCSNMPSNWNRLRELVATADRNGKVTFSVAPSLVDHPFMATTDVRPAARIVKESDDAKAFGKVRVPNCAFCSGHFKNRRMRAGLSPGGGVTLKDESAG